MHVPHRSLKKLQRVASASLTAHADLFGCRKREVFWESNPYWQLIDSSALTALSPGSDLGFNQDAHLDASITSPACSSKHRFWCISLEMAT
jgi:hypothetical protein